MTAAVLEIAIARRKTITGMEWKAAGDGVPDGSFRATFATLGVVDKDLDVILPGAVPNGKSVPISAYGHSSWGGMFGGAAVLPVGKAAIGSDQQTAWVEGELFLDTVGGLDTYRTLKALGPLAEWSFGYRVTKSSVAADDLAKYPGAEQIILAAEVFEASPVLVGAGIGTRTDFVKSVSTLAERGEQLAAVTSEYLVHTRAAVSMRAKEGRVLSQANVDRVTSVADSLDEAAVVLRQLVDEAQPAAKPMVPMSEQECADAGGRWHGDSGMCEMPMADASKAIQRAIRDAELDNMLRRMRAGEGN